jgi:hypothetical protein
VTTTTSVHASIGAALTGAGVAWVYGPAEELPTAADGLIAQAAVVYPNARLNVTSRMSGASSRGEDSTVIHCVGATARDALAVGDKVHAALNGLVLSDKGSPLRQTASLRPEAEPNADPVRVALAVEYSTTTKG